MKSPKGILFVLMLLSFVLLHAQTTNQWTWMGGNKVADQSGRYGTKGVASTNNYPGTRFGSIYFSDKNGNFWLFGGTGIDAAGNGGLLNDLWKFDGTNWTWVSGSNIVNQSGTRATRGTPNPANTPGSRQYGAGGVDNNGNIWIFGGEGYFDTTQIIGPASTGDALNDLWKFDGYNWTWIKGGNGWVDKEPGGSFYYYGVFGTQGVATKTNNPGVRKYCLSWIDLNGNFWIFGGDGYADSTYYPTGSTGALSDLWKWDGANWTWMGGNRAANVSPVYGVKGLPTPSNSPGGRREGSTSWSDKNGNFWLFGGVAYNTSNNSSYSNDLWKYDGTNWTWISGSDTGNQLSNYGSLGIAASSNTPGARRFASGWTDTSGTSWLFGGISTYPLPFGYLNDIWKWDGTNWTWVSGADTVNKSGFYGTKGVASINNTPGSRWKAMAWSNKYGKQMLFGGTGLNNSDNNTPMYFNDQWSWDGAEWTWLNGIDSFGVNEPGIYGTKGVSSSNNWPEARANGSSWTDVNGNLWFFGGESLLNSYNYFNDLWKFDGINWTWVSGSTLKNQPANFGTKGVTASTNMPGASSSNPNWTDKMGNQWILIDKSLWKWDGVNWTWMHQDTTISMYPRTNSAFWTDKNGNFWLMGGNVYNGALGHNNQADQWEWDGTNWKSIYNYPYNSTAIYGTIGVADKANFPGARDGMTIWKDSSDNIWLFGGVYGYSVPIGSRVPVQGPGPNNDLWKWDGNAWTLVQDSKNGNYGIKGVPSPNNQPTSRTNAAGWVGTNGNFWLFGGSSNDLWVRDGKYWTWMAGSNTIDQFSNYGIKGSPSTNNSPGARIQPLSWKDNAGNFWLWGGEIFTYPSGNFINHYGYLNDLWKFNYGYVTALPNSPTIIDTHSSLLLLNNPSFTDEFQFLSDQYYKKIQWQLLDENGRLLQEGELQSIPKNAVQTVVTHHINSGIYFIIFIGDDKKFQTLKWLKL